MVLAKPKSVPSAESSTPRRDISSSGGGSTALDSRPEHVLVRDEPRAVAVEINDELLVAELADGRIVAAPLRWFPRLVGATNEQRQNLEVLGDGVLLHWPDVDEDVAVETLLRR
jgi:hypothetical protein